MSEYQEYGYDNENPNYAHHYIIPQLLKLINENKESNILDIGCGNGSLALELTRIGFNHLYGTDASENGIEIANRNLKGRFFIQDLNSDELPEELKHIKFDILISTEVIEHLYDPAAFITFCKAILLKNGGGALVLSTPYHGYLKNLVLSIFNKWDHHHTVFWRGGHIKFWSFNTLSKLLKDNGFKGIEFRGCGRFPYLWKSMIIKAKI